MRICPRCETFNEDTDDKCYVCDYSLTKVIILNKDGTVLNNDLDKVSIGSNNVFRNILIVSNIVLALGNAGLLIFKLFF